MAENFNGDLPNNNSEQDVNSQNNPFSATSTYGQSQPQQSVNSSSGSISQNQDQPTQKTNNQGPLTAEEKEYLKQISEQNYLIKKTTKRFKRSSLSDNARYLSKIRRLYTSKIGHRYFYFPIIKVTNLRNRSDEKGKSGAALFSAAARKTKRLVVSLVIVFAILAVIGTGSFVTLTVINGPQNNYNPNGFTIVNEDEISGNIDNYIMGDRVNLPVKIKNSTNSAVEVRFHIELVADQNSQLSNAIEEGALSLSDLVVTYDFDDFYWELGSDGYLYYKGLLESSETDEVELISGFTINLTDNATSDENDWEGYSIRLNFIVEYGEE